jgi:transposase
MMGERLVRQDRLFYEICLEDKVPPDHLVRRLDAVLDLGWLRAELAPYYSHTGCPSVDPELMIRMVLLGYCYSIRSDRRLCQEVDMNFAYRWFCRLGLEGRVPDHSTFSVNRHGRFRDSDILRRVFESVVRQCMAAGLVGGEGFAVDASVVEADASRFKRVEGSEIDWTDEQRARRPVQEYLTALDGENAPTNPGRRPVRKVPRDVNEQARDYVRSLMGAEAYRQSGRERKKIETLFGDIKRNLGLTRLRLRGRSGAKDEFLLAATVQNLRRLAKLAAIPPPRPQIA